MKKSFIVLIVFVGTLTSVSAQQSLNDYKYIVVPNKFEFFKEADKYRLNSLTKFLFKKYNFEAFLEAEVLPVDYTQNNCLALKADVINKSTMLKTKLIMQLKNCNNKVIYTSPVGGSKEKNYKVSYNEALRRAFKSLTLENYSYNPKNVLVAENVVEVVEEKQEAIDKLKNEIKILKDKKQVVITPPKAEKKVVKETAVAVLPLTKTKNNLDLLYAQKTLNGYQLVDKTPKVIFNIKKTGLSNVYLVQGKQAILYKVDANWILEYYENKQLQTKLIDIKF